MSNLVKKSGKLNRMQLFVGVGVVAAIGVAVVLLAWASTDRAIITLRAVTSARNSSNSSDNTVLLNKPANTQPGDILIAGITHLYSFTRETTYSNPGACSKTPGWTELLSDKAEYRDSGDLGLHQFVCYKIAGPSEPSSYRFDAGAGSGPGIAGHLLAYGGVDSNNPVQATTKTVRQNPGYDLNAQSISTEKKNTMAVAFYGRYGSGDTLVPAGENILTKRVTTLSNIALAAVADGLVSASGSKTGQNIYQVYGNGSYVSSTVSIVHLITLNPGSLPTATPSSTPGTGGMSAQPPAKKKTATNTKPSTSAPDTSAPAAPVNFKADVATDSPVVALSWDAVNDPSGIRAYQLERSSDRKTWVTLGDSLTETTFADSTVSYKTIYYYRLKAIDNAGNIGAYTADIEVTTTSFIANVDPKLDSTITSDDGLATIMIPAGAITSPALCKLSSAPLGAEFNDAALATYALACRVGDGSIVETFALPAVVTIQLSKTVLAKYTNFKLSEVGDDGKLKLLASSPLHLSSLVPTVQAATIYDANEGTITAQLDHPAALVVTGSAKPNYWPTIISILLLLGLGGGGAGWMLYKRALRIREEKYIRDKYYNLAGGAKAGDEVVPELQPPDEPPTAA